MSKRFIIVFVLLFSILFSTFAVTYEPKEDKSSTYKPTQIVNGSFDDYPWMNYTYQGIRHTSWPFPYIDDFVESIEFHGVNEGWNTTETKTWAGNLFEFIGEEHQYEHNIYISTTEDRYVEMNCCNSAVLYQDLYTFSGDIIRWTLKHGVVKDGDSIQSLRVEIGAPQRDISGNIYNASGIGTNLNWKDHTKLIQDSVAIFRSNGVTNTSGTNSTIGFGVTDELKYLSLSRSTYYTKETPWMKASGVYLVPENQTVTRFAFISESQNPISGNLLDEITFSTLVGNLSADKNWDGSITIKGYWGDSESSKKLCIKFDTETTATDVDMSGVLNKNFTITVPLASIPEGAKTIDVYHQDYVDAKRSVDILYPIYYLGLSDATVEGNPKGYDQSSESITLNNPTKEGWFFTGWSGTGLEGYSNMEVVIPQGSTGARYYTAHFSRHEHHWIFGTSMEGRALTAYCNNDDDYSYLCEYHDSTQPLVLELDRVFKKQLTAIVNDAATLKTVSWKSMDETVATVDKNGLVTGLIPGGSTTISATANDGSKVVGTCVVHIPE